LLAIVFPCAIVFADDNPLGGIAALAMQASVILWIPAVMWAWKIVHQNDLEKPTVTAKPKPTPRKPGTPPKRSK